MMMMMIIIIAVVIVIIWSNDSNNSNSFRNLAHDDSRQSADFCCASSTSYLSWYLEGGDLFENRGRFRKFFIRLNDNNNNNDNHPQRVWAPGRGIKCRKVSTKLEFPCATTKMNTATNKFCNFTLTTSSTASVVVVFMHTTLSNKPTHDNMEIQPPRLCQRADLQRTSPGCDSQHPLTEWSGHRFASREPPAAAVAVAAP